MKKYIKFMAFAIAAVFSLAIISCGNDDNDETPIEGNQIEINGIKYSVLEYYVMGIGAWFETYKGVGNTILFMHIPIGSAYGSYVFTCKSPHSPQVGDDLSKMEDFEVTRDFYVESKVEMEDYSYSSGSAKVVSTDKDKSRITIQFRNLKMVYDSYSYTFNGTVYLPFDFDN